MEVLLIPPVAFAIYLILVGVLALAGRTLATTIHPTSDAKVTAYASGEEAPTSAGVAGYRPFIRTALFFAVLHLGVLVLAWGGFSAAAVVYVLGLIAVLLALILG